MTDLFKRREFLARLWKWGAGLVGAAAVWTTWDILQPATAAGFGGVVKAVTPDLVPEGGVLEVSAARGYLTKIDGEVVALWWKCPHLGCRVPWCESSGQFECPCHGSVFNRVGEHRAGPSPRGMDRFGIEEVDGVLFIDTGTIVQGSGPGTESLGEPPRGPACTSEA
jgi:cytochrome b6-f complex iron-sulfur subunit